MKLSRAPGPEGKQKSSAPKRVDWKALEIVQANAAGIDGGGSEHWVAIGPDRDSEPVQALRVLYRGSARDGPVAGGVPMVAELARLWLNHRFQPSEEIRIARRCGGQQGISTHGL